MTQHDAFPGTDHLNDAMVPADQFLPTDRMPDHEFFHDETGHPRGQSWDAENTGFPVTLGRIEAGTIARHKIETPEILVVHEGNLAVRLVEDLDRGVRELRYPYSPFFRNIMFALPVGREFELEVTDSDFIYTCFYPKTEEEQEKIVREAVRNQSHPVHPLRYTMSEGYWSPEDSYRDKEANN